MPRFVYAWKHMRVLFTSYSYSTETREKTFTYKRNVELYAFR